MGQELGKIDRELADQVEALGKASQELKLEMAQTGLSAAGIVDPTPISDTINACISFARGDPVGGIIDLASGWLPYVGDSLKTLKAGKTAKKIADLKKQIETANEYLKKFKELEDRYKEAAKRVREARKAKACEKACGELRWGTRLPGKDKGDFIGDPGNSTWVSKDKTVTIEYKEGYPDFSTAKINGEPAVIKEFEFPQKGNHSSVDITKANNRAGYSAADYKEISEYYVWHHKEDGVTMQLVNRKAHDSALGGGSHIGGSSIVNDAQF